MIQFMWTPSGLPVSSLICPKLSQFSVRWTSLYSTKVALLWGTGQVMAQAQGSRRWEYPQTFEDSETYGLIKLEVTSRDDLIQPSAFVSCQTLSQFWGWGNWAFVRWCDQPKVVCQGSDRGGLEPGKINCFFHDTISLPFVILKKSSKF